MGIGSKNSSDKERTLGVWGGAIAHKFQQLIASMSEGGAAPGATLPTGPQPFPPRGRGRVQSGPGAGGGGAQCRLVATAAGWCLQRGGDAR